MAHAHDHSHGHAHDHDHGGDNHFLDQACTVAICGLLGGVAVAMYATGMLDVILVPEFFIPVLAGGCVLLALTVIRAVALWQEAGQAKAHAHSHAHDHAHHHEHDHGHGDGHHHGHDHHHEHHHHGHDHGHDHGWSPWRYAVLVLPVTLYFLGLPNAGFSKDRLKGMLGEAVPLADRSAEWGTVTGRAAPTVDMMAETFQPGPARDSLRGKIVEFEGMYGPIDEKSFTVFDTKKVCCAADTILVRVRGLSPAEVGETIPFGVRVRVKGQLQFRNLEGRSDLIPVIIIQNPKEDLQIVEGSAG